MLSIEMSELSELFESTNLCFDLSLIGKNASFMSIFIHAYKRFYRVVCCVGFFGALRCLFKGIFLAYLSETA